MIPIPGLEDAIIVLRVESINNDMVVLRVADSGRFILGEGDTLTLSELRTNIKLTPGSQA